MTRSRIIPSSPKRRCSKIGCPTLVYKGRCSQHKHSWGRGLTAQERGYGSQWAALRRDRLAQDPNCRCGEPATEVDHVIPVAEGGPSVWDNTMSICKDCHQIKTARERKRGLQRAAARRAAS